MHFVRMKQTNILPLLYVFVVEIIEENTNFNSKMFCFGARKSGFYIKF